MSRRITARDLTAIRNGIAERSIVLVGLMGAGKSTVGRRLAERLELPFIDADSRSSGPPARPSRRSLPIMARPISATANGG